MRKPSSSDTVGMNDPHVVALIYRIRHSEGVSFEQAQPIEFQTSLFSARVDGQTARFEFKKHFNNVPDAAAAIGTYIEVWESWDALEPVPTAFRLEYEKSEVVDRKRPPGNHGRMVLQPLQMSGGNASTNKELLYFPEPPAEIAAVNEDVRVMAYQHWKYQQGRASLAPMAYFCLTILETSTGNYGKRRKAAADYYGVELAVLDKIGQLTSERGGREARKAHGVAHDLTQADREWLERIIIRLIRRAAAVATDPNDNRPIISM